MGHVYRPSCHGMGTGPKSYVNCEHLATNDLTHVPEPVEGADLADPRPEKVTYRRVSQHLLNCLPPDGHLDIQAIRWIVNATDLHP
jgi:hypothetical protein